jgi:cell division protein FtsW (lipid II flippase)
VPELPLMLACIAAEFAHLFPRTLGAVSAMLLLLVAPVAVARRRRRMIAPPQPDYFGASVGAAVFMACIAILRIGSENGSMGAFVLVVFVALASVRIGRGVGSRLEASAQTGGQAAGAARRLLLVESLLLAAPLILLLPLAGLDMGLGLVMVVPLGFATLLAAGWRAARWRLLVPSLAMLGVLLLARQVVFPTLRPIREAESHAAQATAFARLSTPLGARLPMLETPMDRAAARSITTRDRPLAEALLIAAHPGPARDLLIPSIEQIWGAQAYANAGLLGEGLGQAVIGGRGVAETVSYAENTFSVFVLSEHGAVGGLLVLGLYLLLTGAVAACVLASAADTPSYRASRALFLVAALVVAVPALYVALSNLGLVPITGQNMPFLGLNAWSDVAICAGVVGILVTGAMRSLEEGAR